ncbi:MULTISPECIES: cupin domain-containing protein [unclassified Porphyromonas]|uniref:cupin domain-containing protein n=1 Tax=unclassified Porphyromonas TaxID=2645799 RepID=UPI00052CFD65|nr:MULTISPECIES: cupin domain-containing protein [unclassified Porphyromonas]KGN86390.1 cupin [Porphyromonas sp. COT-290 OH860]KGO00937.1 cupin [Porphyromonas sp. COT-290 OH3588]
MLGNKLSQTGRLIDNKELMLVHLQLEAGGSVPAHDHVGQEVFFTVVKGIAEVTLNQTEKHRLTPGEVLHFAGEASVSVYAVEDVDFFVYLINRQ